MVVRSRGLAALLGLTLGLAACGGFPKNPPLNTLDRDSDYRFQRLAVGQGNTDETFVILTLSGGGTRAAALSYGVMRALEEVELPSGASLLDEVDVISSVSGGSFAAAYYGVHGKERFFTDFEQDVLHRRLHRDLLLRALAPWNWPKLMQPSYGRSDLAAEFYHEHIFGGATYGKLPRRRPFIVLNATDMARGTRFSFIQDYFDLLCSDLNGVPVARGVTASSAFPIAFTPLTLENYPKASCGYQRPRWMKTALEKDLERNPMRYDRARQLDSYADGERTYLHLADGGLADNIGLRGPATAVTWLESPYGLIPLMNEPGRIERIVFIIVDAKPEGPSELDRTPRPPGFVRVLNAAATGPMEAYSSETVELTRTLEQRWEIEKGAMDHMRAACEAFATDLCLGDADLEACQAARQATCFEQFGVVPPEEDPTGQLVFHRIHVRFAAEKDEQTREDLQRIGTWLQLPQDEVELLVDAGSRLLRASPGFRDLLLELDAVEPIDTDRRRGQFLYHNR